MAEFDYVLIRCSSIHLRRKPLGQHPTIMKMRFAQASKKYLLKKWADLQALLLYYSGSHGTLSTPVRLALEWPLAQLPCQLFKAPMGPNNSFKPTPHRGVGHVPALR